MLPQVKYIKQFVDTNQIDVECAPVITERIATSFICQECVVENYSKLKEKFYYTMTHKEECSERTLKLYKTNRIQRTKENEIERVRIDKFQFHCELTNSDIREMSSGNLTNKMEFYIMYDQDETICPGDLDETNYGFSIEVPNEIIADRRNKYLWENDKLILQFRYRHYYNPRDPICRSGLPGKRDEERLSEDLLALYESGNFADFTLWDEEKRNHVVHKSICRTRSAVIDKIDDDGLIGIVVGGKSYHVEIAVRYMYSGILPQLSVDDLLNVLEVAEELEIESLILSIKLALLNILNKNNAKKIIRKTSHHFDMYQIVCLAQDFFNPQKNKIKTVSQK